MLETTLNKGFMDTVQVKDNIHFARLLSARKV